MSTSGLCNSIMEVVTESLNEQLAESDGASFRQTLTDRQKKQIANCIRREIKISRTMSDKGAYLPYQECLTEPQKAAIDNGSLGLYELCMSETIGAKRVDQNVLTANSLYSNLYIPAQAMYGFSLRHFHALLQDTDASAIRGDRANRVHFDTFWDATSPNIPTLDNTKRFSLISSVLAMRKAAMFKKGNEFDAFVHYEHPKNCLLYADSFKEQISRCGQLYNGIMSITKAYNAVICAAYGKPVKHSDNYNAMLASQFSETEAKQAIAAVVRCFAKHPELTTNVANICYNNIPDSNTGKHQNCKQLFAHITTKTPDQVQNSLLLQQQLNNQEWSPVSHLPQITPKEQKPDEFRIGDAFMFPWITPSAAQVDAVRTQNTTKYFENGRHVRQRPYSNRGHNRQIIEHEAHKHDKHRSWHR